MTFNQAKSEEAQRKGAIVGHDNDYHTTTAMTAAEVNKNNEKLWGNIGPASAPEAARDARSIPVYRGMMAADEVSPTQSAPPDARGDNLLGETAVAGDSYEERSKAAWEKGLNVKLPSAEEAKKIHEEAMKKLPKQSKAKDDLSEGEEARDVPQGDGVASAARAGAEIGKKVAEGHAVDSPDPEPEVTAKLKRDKEKRDYEAVHKRAAVIKANPNEANRGAKRDGSVGN